MSAQTEARAARGNRLWRWLTDRPDDTVLLWAFRGLLVVTFVVLGLDLAELQRQMPEDAAAARPAIPALAPPDSPYLPSVRQDIPGRIDVDPDATAMLKQTARFDLVEGGRLIFEGAIDQGTAERFGREIEKRGAYVRTVVINSPGGSVADALAIARMIRDAGYDTEIGPNGYCASSCPLVFAGGRNRVAARDASLGVHRVFGTGGGTRDPATVMVETQRVSAECQRFLIDMGVDARVWIHAMETPREELFYFTTKELIELRLATRIADAAK